MKQVVIKWVKVTVNKVVNSIAFLPAVIAIIFLLLSFAMVEFDFSATGKNIKSNLHWLSLKDANTARSICSAIVGGILSLAVFSFSMVMILLNQAASQMSNRILGKLIGNRFQQIVLGFYIGTIVYALFLLSTIRDINSGIYVPAISTYLLIAFTITDIFLFIYFLHYITDSVKFETIIHRIYDSTKAEMNKKCLLKGDEVFTPDASEAIKILSYKSGLYQGFEKNGLISLCKKENVSVAFLQPVGTYLIKGTPILSVSFSESLPDNFEEKLHVLINIHRGQQISTGYFYGFSHLMEIAVKALSPGINDPGTAVISLHALGDLLAFRQGHFPEVHLRDEDGIIRVKVHEKSFGEMFADTILPIWDYGKKDRLIQKEMFNILTQLKLNSTEPLIDRLLSCVNAEKEKIQGNC